MTIMRVNDSFVLSLNNRSCVLTPCVIECKYSDGTITNESVVSVWYDDEPYPEYIASEGGNMRAAYRSARWNLRYQYRK